MSRGEHDPERAERAVRELAAMTDAELARSIREAAAAVLALIDEGTVRLTGLDWWAADAVEASRRALAELPSDATVPDLVAAVRPLLNAWWPDSPASVRPIHRAVEALRAAAMHMPGLVDDARRITSRGEFPP